MCVIVCVCVCSCLALFVCGVIGCPWLFRLCYCVVRGCTLLPVAVIVGLRLLLRARRCPGASVLVGGCPLLFCGR